MALEEYEEDYAEIPTSEEDSDEDTRPIQRISQQQEIILPEDSFWSWNLPGRFSRWYQPILFLTFPCLVGNPCSKVRRKDYCRLLVSFLFWIQFVNIAYFIIELALGVKKFNWRDLFFHGVRPSNSSLIKLGAKYAYAIKHHYQIWRLFVPIIMHGGIFHLVVNMLVVIIDCLGYEKIWGFIRIILIYVVSGVAGNLLSCIVFPNNLSVGASSAIMGLYGARLSHLVCRWPKLKPNERTHNIVSAIIYTCIMMVFVFETYTIDYASHIGGCFVGIFMGFILFANYHPKKLTAILVALFSAFVILAYFVLCTVVFIVWIKPVKIE
mmetsp:Transcript_13767/g.20867  ORF Transcript_13767/g.20867 Transcript_13767/m.20867 type:complete len:324 (+) Transcript_13767:119-1090(+)